VSLFLTCSICGRRVEIPKWHEDYEKLRQASEAKEPYICPACADRIRAEALDQSEKEGGG
jgi:uncharacterized protein YlaI